MSNDDDFSSQFGPVESRSPDREIIAARTTAVGVEASRKLNETLAGVGRRTLAQELASGLGGPTLKHAVGANPLRDFTRDTKRVDSLYEQSGLGRLASYKSPVEEVLNSLNRQRTAFSGLNALSEHVKRVQAWAKPLGGLGVVQNQVGLDASGVFALARSARWADGIGNHQFQEMNSVLRKNARIGTEIERLASAAAAITGAGDLHRRLGLGTLGDLTSKGTTLKQTALRMSLFAGAMDVVGPKTIVGDAAFDALLGRWRTRSDLPAAFWRSREARVDHYREAEVDEGLVDSDNATVLEVLVESGVVEGETRRGRVVAVVEAGPVRLEISSGRTRLASYRAIDAFEVALRGFVAAKLEAVVSTDGHDPSQWFKRRVPGDILNRAKTRRLEALKNGEPRAPLIAFTDLGDLIQIILRRDNWSGAFEAVFINADAFKVDMERLTASRRAAMHGRIMDGVRLVELICVIRRLDEMMRQDGGWGSGWDDDF